MLVNESGHLDYSPVGRNSPQASISYLQYRVHFKLKHYTWMPGQACYVVVVGSCDNLQLIGSAEISVRTQNLSSVLRPLSHVVIIKGSDS